MPKGLATLLGNIGNFSTESGKYQVVKPYLLVLKWVLAAIKLVPDGDKPSMLNAAGIAAD